jgi:carboxyl-terminal processing protease
MGKWVRRQWARGLITLIISSLILIAPIAAVAKDADKYTELDEVIDLLQTFHLSGITEAQLIQYAIEGIIWELDDPYTEYLSPARLDGFMSDLNYVYEGTGVVLDESEGEYVVSTVFEGSSAQQQGLIEGDIITSINGMAISDESDYDLFDVQFGEQGSSVRVTVMRDGKSIELELDYSDIQVPTVTSLLVGEGTGYIRLNTFSDEAVDQFALALATLKSQGLRQLILDLRDNSGGLIDAVQKIAGHFLPAGPLAYLEDRNGREQTVNIIAQDISVAGLPLVILTNEGSASASETLVGALQDYKAGIVIGEQTYGKGVVQKIFPLFTSGGSLKVTV